MITADMLAADTVGPHLFPLPSSITTAAIYVLAVVMTGAVATTAFAVTRIFLAWNNNVLPSDATRTTARGAIGVAITSALVLIVIVLNR